MSFEIDQGQNIQCFKANGWIRVGFTKAMIEIAKKTFGYESLSNTLKGYANIHKYNLNPKKNIVPKNRKEIKTLRIPKNSID